MIRRVRAGFLALGLVLLVLLGLLLSRALESLDREREVRHAAVASRVFDEAERALSEFLRKEEGRPAHDYFGVDPSGAASPLLGPPSHDFVVGYFQLDERGTLSTPHGGESEGVLRKLGSGSPALRGKAKRRDLQAEFFQKEAGEADQDPGTTRTVQKLDLLTGRGEIAQEEALAGLEEESKPNESPSPYRVLDRLNLASKMRQERRVAISESEPEQFGYAEMLDEAEAPAPPVELPATAPPELQSRDALELALKNEPRARRLEQTTFAEVSRLSAPSSSSALGRLPAPMGPSPMMGAALGSGELVLYRTVVIPERGPYQQGVLLDLARFTRWLEARVLGASGLRQFVELEFRTTRSLAADAKRITLLPTDRFVYQHRFGEPFEALSARLSLAALPDEGGIRYVYAIGLLLVIASTAGLWAVYRRVATAVHFAERRSNFAAAVSHELKTPLTAIRMYAEMLRDGMVPDEAKRREYYDTITSESERLTRLINNVLEFSRLETQKSDGALVTRSLEQPLRHVVQLLQPHVRAEGFELVLELEPGLPPATYDPDALEQLLFNLIDNALKYAREAERKEICLHACAVDDGVAIRVRDYGPGVAREHHRRIFEAFYRGENELTRRTKGTGIGLALVQGLADRMDAGVSARNHPDGGFEVELRLSR